MKYRHLAIWLAFASWFVVLFILSSVPGERLHPPPYSWTDKVVHVAAFLVGSFLLASACFCSGKSSLLKSAIFAFIVMVLIGVGDEFHQSFTPGRSGNDRGDLAADAIGALIGIACARLLHGKRSHPPAPAADRPA